MTGSAALEGGMPTRLGGQGARVAQHPYRLFGGYRLALATMVLLSHSPGFLPAWIAELSLGNVGVFSFFVLSGFVIAEALDIFYRDNVKGFAVNRFLKIYPTFWAASLLAYAVLWLLGEMEFPPDPMLVAVNFTIMIGYTPVGGELLLLTLAWAVIVELIFYALIGLVTALGGHWRRVPEALGIAAVLSLAAYLYVDHTESFSRSFAVFRYAPFFVAGAAYYYVVSRRSRGAAVFLALGVVASLHSYWVYHEPVAEHVRQGTVVLLVVVNACFGFLAWLQCPGSVEAVDKRMGDLTYGVYLCHMPVIWLVGVFSLIPPVESLIVAAASVAIAWFVFISVERPVFGLRDRFRGARLYT